MEEDPRSSCAKVANEHLHEEGNDLHLLEQRKNWDGDPLVKYNGFWFRAKRFPAVLSTRKHFKAKDDDIILSSHPKSGTTWLKALTFAIVNRGVYTIDDDKNKNKNHPLLTSNPHTLVPSFEFNTTFAGGRDNPPDISLDQIPSPRMFATHIPFSVLPDSIRDSERCRVIYICRNPLDQVISHWHFLVENKTVEQGEIHTMDEAIDIVCREGVSPYGPFWDHVLGFWEAHLKNPQKILFLKYEDLKDDVECCVRRIAQFVGLPFSVEEEEQGLVERISRMCNFENLSNLEVNNSEELFIGVYKKRSFFRKGEVGDWKNYLSPVQAEKVLQLMESKFEGSGWMFKTCNEDTGSAIR